MLYFQHKFFAEWEPNETESDEDYSSSAASDEEGEESEDEDDDDDEIQPSTTPERPQLVTPGGMSMQSQPKRQGEQITRGQDLMGSRKDERQTDLWTPSSDGEKSERQSMRSKQ